VRVNLFLTRRRRSISITTLSSRLVDASLIITSLSHRASPYSYYIDVCPVYTAHEKTLFLSSPLEIKRNVKRESIEVWMYYTLHKDHID